MKTAIGTASKFRSRIDWWVWLCMALMLSIVLLGFYDHSLAAIIIGAASTALFIILILGCWYEIDGDELVVYQFFKATRFPINKMKEVKKTTGYLATAGMSHLRVSISFTDRSVLKSYAPLEISPKDRDGFIARLKAVNCNIIVHAVSKTAFSND